jgi:hypothetical protein
VREENGPRDVCGDVLPRGACKNHFRADNSSAHAIEPLSRSISVEKHATPHTPATNTTLCKATRGSRCTSAHRKVPRPIPTKLPLKPWLGREVSVGSSAARCSAGAVQMGNVTGRGRKSLRCAGRAHRWGAAGTCSDCYGFAVKEERSGVYNEKADETAAPVTPASV